MFQIGGIGPMFGQLDFFHEFAGKDYEDAGPVVLRGLGIPAGPEAPV